MVKIESCLTGNNITYRKNKRRNFPIRHAMSRFKQIDISLSEYANRLHARLTKDRPGYPEALRTFEERRIDWQEGNIHKAIIIQPNFEHTGVNSNIWNFINLAWSDDGHSTHRPRWIKMLVDQDKFEIIETNIVELLNKSEENLKQIGIDDLKREHRAGY